MSFEKIYLQLFLIDVILSNLIGIPTTTVPQNHKTLNEKHRFEEEKFSFNPPIYQAFLDDYIDCTSDSF